MSHENLLTHNIKLESLTFLHRLSDDLMTQLRGFSKIGTILIEFEAKV
ncbi:hypothetical protein [Vibrio gallaecicus]|nr:hypothetical protein [Vibrio gallaecicus]MDN3614952.1 hypothetical protein [Vibrio gallaecicus]